MVTDKTSTTIAAHLRKHFRQRAADAGLVIAEQRRFFVSLGSMTFILASCKSLVDCCTVAVESPAFPCCFFFYPQIKRALHGSSLCDHGWYGV